jgi:hypothetical protein
MICERFWNSLRKASKTGFKVEDAINANDGDPATLIGRFQFLAQEYALYGEIERRPKYKNYRQVLKHIVAADFEDLPETIRDRVIPPTLRNSLKGDFAQVRHNALTILNSKPKRGALRKGARFYFVDELAGIYEQFTGRPAAKVGKDSGAKSPRKALGFFYDFVLAALNPIDPHACTGIRDVIDEVIDARRKGRDLNLPLKLSC